jgi:dTDP-4-amino-4,6-dideoxygalactose transaminase
LGGDKTVTDYASDLFTWPIVTREDEEAVLEVLRRGAMSDTDVTKAFEADFKQWQGTKYALGYNCGTSSIHGALYGCGIGRGDEVICMSTVYWAAVLPILSFGAVPVFADIEFHSLCMCPADFERKITPHTKAVMVVHNFAHPANMDAIMPIAKKHGLKVIEDVSHAHGTLYKGKMAGTFGDVAAMSLMSQKSLPVGEAGMLVTDNLEIYERAIAYGHYERFTGMQTEYLRKWEGLPLGGHKQRMHQASAAMGRVQLKHYDERAAEIRKAMNYFWDCLEGVPGIRAHRVDESDGSNMGGFYAAHGLYAPEELGGLSVTRFVQALNAEGVKQCSPGINRALHTHPLMHSIDLYNDGKPTRHAFAKRGLPERDHLPVSETISQRSYFCPWFKKCYKSDIERFAEAFRKVSRNYAALLEGDVGDPEVIGKFYTW